MLHCAHKEKDSNRQVPNRDLMWQVSEKPRQLAIIYSEGTGKTEGQSKPESYTW